MTRKARKVTISFPTARAMWYFFETSELKEFRLDSSKCSVTGRFLPFEIERARKEMDAIIGEVHAC